MDDGVLDAEANINQRGHSRRSSPHHSGLNNGESVALDGAGSMISRTLSDEETPLLARDPDRHSPSISKGARIDKGRAQIENDAQSSSQPDFENISWWRRPSIYWMLGPFLLFTLAFGGTMIPKINLIQDLLCREYYMKQSRLNPNICYVPIAFGKSDERCTVPEVEAAAAQFTMASNLIAGILSSITSPKLGALSDRYGRLNILSLTTVGLLVSEVLTIIAAMHPETVSPYWILLGYALDGLGGSFIAGMAISHSYAADCTEPAKRNVAFGYFHGVLFTGVALGPLVAAQIIRWTGSLVSIFWLALACHIIFVSCLLFVIPESLSKRRQFAARAALEAKVKKAEAEDNHTDSAMYGLRTIISSIKSFLEPLKILYPTGPGSSMALRRNLMLIATIDTIVFGVAMGAMTVVAIYIRKQFHWDAARQSTYVSTVNIVRVLCLFVVLPLVTWLVRGRARGSATGHDEACRPGVHSDASSITVSGSKQDQAEARKASDQLQSSRQTGADTLDLVLLRLGIAFDTIGFLGYTLARTPMLFTLSGITAAAGGIASPTLQSGLTKHVPSDRTGAILGASGLLHGLARVVAPVVFNSVFAATAGTFRQAVFVCLTATFGVAFMLSWGIRPGIFLEDEVDHDRQEEVAREREA